LCNVELRIIFKTCRNPVFIYFYRWNEML